MLVLLAESAGIAEARRHRRRNREKNFASAVFGAEEASWWSGLEERKMSKKSVKSAVIWSFRFLTV